MKRVVLVIGGARSGKSRFAEGLATAHRGPKTYIATAQAFDEEMRQKIARHVAQRGPSWETAETPLDLAPAITAAARADGFVLVECVTLWLNNLMHHARAPEAEVAQLCDALSQVDGTVVLVSNEVGQGIVPDNALARAFRDASGLANQALAAAADEVYFIVAGLPVTLKKAKPAVRSLRRAPSSRGRRG